MQPRRLCGNLVDLNKVKDPYLNPVSREYTNSRY